VREKRERSGKKNPEFHAASFRALAFFYSRLTADALCDSAGSISLQKCDGLVERESRLGAVQLKPVFFVVVCFVLLPFFFFSSHTFAFALYFVTSKKVSKFLTALEEIAREQQREREREREEREAALPSCFRSVLAEAPRGRGAAQGFLNKRGIGCASFFEGMDN